MSLDPVLGEKSCFGREGHPSQPSQLWEMRIKGPHTLSIIVQILIVSRPEIEKYKQPQHKKVHNRNKISFSHESNLI